MTTMRNTHKKDEYLKDMKNRLRWYNIYLIKTLEDYRKSEVEGQEFAWGITSNLWPRVGPSMHRARL